MKRTAIGFCVAAALSCVATLGAQIPSTSTSADQRTPTTDKAKEISVTGCLSKGADGKYVLTSAKIDSPADATAGTSGTTTPPATAGTTPSTPSATANAASTWALSGGSDLDKHVGHKVQITGKATMDSRMPDPTAAAAGSAATGSAATGAVAAGTVGTSGSTATAAAEEQRNKDTRSASQPQLDVQSVKMIAATCS
jgi:hypothetical protein